MCNFQSPRWIESLCGIVFRLLNNALSSKEVLCAEFGNALNQTQAWENLTLKQSHDLT